MGKLAKIGAFVAGTAAVLALVVADVAASPSEIGHGTAQLFLNDTYFANALRDPDATLANLTTDNYRALQSGHKPTYSEFWRTVKEVKDTKVTVVPGSKNVYAVQWTYVYVRGPSERTPVVNIAEMRQLEVLVDLR
jgi:hypothetical protein